MAKHCYAQNESELYFPDMRIRHPFTLYPRSERYLSRRRCCDCEEFDSDDFNYGTFSGSWLTVSGSWTRTTGKITTTSSTAILLLKKSLLDKRIKRGFQLFFRLYSDTGTRTRILFSYDLDAGTYNCIEIEWNGANSTIKLLDKLGQEVAVVTRNYLDDDDYDFYMCVTSSHVVFATNNLQVLLEGDVTSTTNAIGFGTVNNTGTVAFGNPFDYDNCHGVCECYGETLDDSIPQIANDTVTVRHLRVEGDGSITFDEIESPCITYYVDSVSGGVAETGSGTEDDPWKNLNSVLSSCTALVCKFPCCPMIKVLVKGTVDYVFGEPLSSVGNYYQKLVIEPWDTERLTIHVTGANKFATIRVAGIVFKHVDCINETTYSGTAGAFASSSSKFDDCTATLVYQGDATQYKHYSFSGCGASEFYECTAYFSAESRFIGGGFGSCADSTFYKCCIEATVASAEQFYGFYYSPSSVFYECSADVEVVGAPNAHWDTAAGFHGCSYSEFYGCTGTAEVSQYASTGKPSGFSSCEASYFYECTGTGTGGGTGSGGGSASGFLGCGAHSTFENCTGTGHVIGDSTGTDYGYGYGFGSCSYGTFLNCTGSGTCTGMTFNHGYGFGNCTNASFDTCDGASLTCGFFGCTNSTFTDCTATPTGGDCDT